MRMPRMGVRRIGRAQGPLPPSTIGGPKRPPFRWPGPRPAPLYDGQALGLPQQGSAHRQGPLSRPQRTGRPRPCPISPHSARAGLVPAPPIFFAKNAYLRYALKIFKKPKSFFSKYHYDPSNCRSEKGV